MTVSSAPSQPLTLKRRIYRTICKPVVGDLLAKIYHERIPSHGCIIDTTNPSILPITKALLFWGIYERAEVRFVGQYLLPNLDVIEFGSSIGVVSSCIARRLAQPARLFCVEANPDLIDTLKTNLALNAHELSVEVIQAAVDYSGKDVWLDKAQKNTDSLVASAPSGSIKLPVITLAQICAQYTVSEFCLVADIEGSEWKMFENEKSTLTRCRRIIAELHDYKDGENTLPVEKLVSKIINEHGFRLLDQRGNVFVFEKS